MAGEMAKKKPKRNSSRSGGEVRGARGKSTKKTRTRLAKPQSGRKSADQRKRKQTGNLPSAPNPVAHEHDAIHTFDLETQDELVPEQKIPSFVIVGIGASAGGLEAMTTLVRGLEAGANFAVVLVLHQSPDHESFLSELLAAATTLPVVQAQERMALEPGHVYVAPPNLQVELERGQIRLVARPVDRTQHMPIDHFFRSLAEYAQSRGVGVVLSGSGASAAMLQVIDNVVALEKTIGDGDGDGRALGPLIGKSVYEIAGGALATPELRTLLEERLATAPVVQDYPIELGTGQEGAQRYTVHARRVGGDRRPPLHVLTFEAK